MKNKTLYDLVCSNNIPVNCDRYRIKLSTLSATRNDYDQFVNYIVGLHHSGTDIVVELIKREKEIINDCVEMHLVYYGYTVKNTNCYIEARDSISKHPEPINVIFNPPATIVFWQDGSKSVVKTMDGDKYDPEKGLAMAFSKKMFGNNYDYYNIFAKWLKKWDKQAKEADSFKDNIRQNVFDNYTENYKQLEEKCATIKQLTGYDIDKLISQIASGNLRVEAKYTGPNEPICCKDCEYFKPANELNKALYPNSTDADGACFGVPEVVYVDAFDTCDQAKLKEEK